MGVEGLANEFGGSFARTFLRACFFVHPVEHAASLFFL
jgi:hypothetical protein